MKNDFTRLKKVSLLIGRQHDAIKHSSFRVELRIIMQTWRCSRAINFVLDNAMLLWFSFSKRPWTGSKRNFSLDMQLANFPSTTTAFVTFLLAQFCWVMNFNPLLNGETLKCHWRKAIRRRTKKTPKVLLADPEFAAWRLMCPLIKSLPVDLH